MQIFLEDLYNAKGLHSSLAEVPKEHRQREEEALSQLGLHVSQELVLFVLWREDGLSQSELAARLRVELPTLTKAVQHMERAGLLIRQSDEKDTRISRVYLTEQGRHCMHLLSKSSKIWKRVCCMG